MHKLGLALTLVLMAVCGGCAKLPMPRYAKVLQPPVEFHNKNIAVVYFDSSNAQVVAGGRDQEQVDELKKTSGMMLAESIALKARARLNTRVDAVAELPSDVEYVIKGKVVEVDPGNAKLRAVGGIAGAIFGGGGNAGGGTFRATGEIYRVKQGGELERIADFEHKADVDGGAFTSDGDVVRAGAEHVATLVANFLEKPRDNNQVN